MRQQYLSKGLAYVLAAATAANVAASDGLELSVEKEEPEKQKEEKVSRIATKRMSKEDVLVGIGKDRGDTGFSELIYSNKNTGKYVVVTTVYFNNKLGRKHKKVADLGKKGILYYDDKMGHYIVRKQEKSEGDKK